MSVTPRGMSIQEAYREYKAGAFIVNRKYQRKLVWTLEEKRKLIDSILHGYPIPLILLATHTDPSGNRSFEILDGMQRLNAIFTFIENRYATLGKYFDVSQLSRAKQLVESGEFEAVNDKTKLLDAADCANLLDYTLAVTEFPATDENAVNDVFGRINAYGRHLSKQEQRQAGVSTQFTKLVRQIASEIRGDVSMDTLDLADMPQISIDVDDTEVSYGIRADDTFWCKQGILRRNQLRESEDEQILADIAISIVEEVPFPFSGENLDKLYDTNSDAHKEINNKLLTYGIDALKNDIEVTLSVLKDTIEQVDPGPNALRLIVAVKATGNPIKTHFYSIFMAFYELCIKDEMTPNNPAAIMKALNNLHKRLEIARGQIRSDNRQKNIDTVKGLIQKYFEKKSPPASQTGSGLAIRFENALRRSKIETSSYECKQGVLRLSEDRTMDDEILNKISRTICGIANIGPVNQGALFVGVADSEKDQARIATLDKVEAKQVGNRFVVGIERESTILSIDLEQYKKMFVDHLSNCGFSEPLRTSVLSKIDCISYQGMSVICLWIESQPDVSHLNEEVYIRRGSSTELVTGYTKLQAVASLFKKS
ncbi:MAG: DUF262 domain-containing protein [Candidatus Marinimicrobia bacterium]|jgi:hypothetical protein|nr:DUF262 domain-containing protein [Candidatus Neomarinimicrobiota bacterium]